jgi:sulfate adenylyltransferase subunit 2
MENIPLPVLYFTHQRLCFRRDDTILAHSEFIKLKETEISEMMQVRFRTIGDMSCTGAVLSEANTVEDIIKEISVSRVTERGTRADDRRSDSAMEDRKKDGYF